ncbi:hypothetical protein HPB50_017730 [Hyalomma asiaticum]|uniref:Uncharacterized protein n=1 Tax=Hyalomma asiaticum TaxID=266040 RepID=A0ACB7SXF2_HYAAI|nr:hypothetical protein HPB50_017730 [Hyalomma asiaticum]
MPVLIKHVCSSVYASDLHSVCGSEGATAACILWDCEQNPREARTVTTIPPWLAAAAGSDQLEEQTRAVQWVSAALENQHPSKNARCPLPSQHRGRRGCQKKVGVAKAARRVEDIMPSLDTLVQLSRSAGPALAPHLPLLFSALLDALSDLESPVLNQLSIRADADARDRVCT